MTSDERLRSVAAVLHIADSMFRGVGCVEPLGLEALVRIGKIFDLPSLQKTLSSHRLLSVDRCDVWFARHAHTAVADSRLGALVGLAHRENTCRPASAQRRASLRAGAALLDRARDSFIGREDAGDLLAAVHDALADVTPLATVTGAAVAALGGNSDDAADAITYMAVSSVATAAVNVGAVTAEEASAALTYALLLPSGELEQQSDPIAGSILLDIGAMQHGLDDYGVKRS